MERVISRRGQFFALDALIALIIIIITVTTISPIIGHSHQKSKITSDVLLSLSSLSVGNFDNAYSRQLIAEGKITDPSKSVLEEIGELYITNISIAKKLAAESIKSIPENENIGIWYGDTLLASRNITPFNNAKTIFTDSQTISGIGGNGTGITGFSTRATLSTSSASKYAYFGGYVGEGNITVEINYQGKINSANIELAINNNFTVLINGVIDKTFQSSPDDFTPVKYSLNSTLFTSGQNTIQIKGDYLHISGGFIKITYNSNVSYGEEHKYQFPGIKGIINLYDGLSIPGDLTNLNISLHFNNSMPTFLTIGKTQIFNASSNGTAPVLISNSTLSSLLNFSELGERTTPIRFGMRNTSYLTNNSRAIDVFSATDISGSMSASCSGTSPWWCCWYTSDLCASTTTCNSCGGILTNKIQDAKDANDLFIDMILNNSKNRVGLTAYSGKAWPADYHQLSNNSTSLKNDVASWNAGGSTCICCGVNKAVAGLLANSTSSKFRSIVVMSDGDANVQCSEQDTGNANLDAIQSACNAYNNYGIKIYTIAFGADANTNTLSQMAECAGGSFYLAIDNLSDIYHNIANELIQTSYSEQTVNVSGNFSSELFPDSYIEYSYTKPSPPTGLVATIEQPFSSEGTANFTIPENATLLKATAVSYSGPQWTSTIMVNNNSIYNLSDYQVDFLKLGDPYSINIPISATSQDNNITLKVGLSPNNLTNGSINDKIIYTILKPLASYTSVSATANGCNWTIQFNNYNLTIQIPQNYSGTEKCEYSTSSFCGTHPNCVDATDSAQIAVYNLLKLLDFNSDGKVDVDLSSNDLKITTSNLGGIPFLFSTEVQVRRWQ